MRKLLFGILFAPMAFGTNVAWADPPTATPVAQNLPTLEAQMKLVEGLSPVKPKMRFRRYLNAPKPAEPPPLPPPPYDLSNTTEAKAGFAELEKIKRNIARSGWPSEPARGNERVIFASDAGKEYELEYDTAELASLAAKAMGRGINDASEERVKRGDALVYRLARRFTICLPASTAAFSEPSCRD